MTCREKKEEYRRESTGGSERREKKEERSKLGLLVCRWKDSGLSGRKLSRQGKVVRKWTGEERREKERGERRRKSRIL